jgi:N-acetylmuramoyl-L-alanine amidase
MKIERADAGRLMNGTRFMTCMIAAALLILLLQPGLIIAGESKERYFEAEAAYKSLRNNTTRQKYRQYWLECIKKYEYAYKDDPYGAWAAPSLYMSGKLYLELYKRSKRTADKNEAIDNFERIVKKFPGSKYRSRAADEIKSVTGSAVLKITPGQKDLSNVELKNEPKEVINKKVEVAAVKHEEPEKLHDLKKEQDKSEQVKSSAEPADAIKEIITADIIRDKGGAENPAPKFPGIVTVTDLRYWSNPNYTRIVIDVDGETEYIHRLLKQDSALNKPQRLFVDLAKSRLGDNIKKVIPINDNLLSDARAGQYEPAAVRVAVDIKSFKTYKIFSLKNPFRIVIDVWGDSEEKVKEEIQEEDEDKKTGTGGLAKQFALGVKKITVDMGHGGDDFGAPGYIKGVHEKDIVLKLGKKLAKKIREDLNCEVIMTRTSDKYLTLEERTAISNTKNSDIFISIHTNASRNKSAYGIETYFLNLATDDEAIRVAARENATSTKNISDLQTILNDLMQNAKINESSRLASHVQESICGHLGGKFDMIKNKGVKQAPFYVLLGAQMPAILVETSFISNKRECERLNNPAYQDMLCDAIVRGIKNYIREINPSAYSTNAPGKGLGG